MTGRPDGYAGFTTVPVNATLRVMLSSFALAIGQLSDPRFRRVLLLGLCATLVLYIALYTGTTWVLAEFRLAQAGWANTLLDLLGGLAVVVLSLALFPSVALLVLSFLLDDIATAVEERHYPHLPAPRHQRLGEIAWGAIRFTLVTLIINALALPLYLALLVVGLGVAIYYVVNGYLLAREYFELVAWRRLDPKAADALRRAHAGRLWLSGLVLAFLSTLPLVNLVAPLIGTAVMVHELERFRGTGSAS